MLKHLLDPKDEVLSGRLQGVIDIERVADPKRRALESRAKDFLNSTFVSGEIRKLVESINQRLNSEDAVAGLFLAEGHKGVGKSHGLLIPLHLANSPADCQEWLAENKLSFSVPAETRVIVRKFTDFPLESLWGVIGDELKVSFRADQPPSLPEFREALAGKKLILILDELESGIRSIGDPAQRQRNLNFLQMISEESGKAGSNVVLIASIYDGNLEPGLTLKRVPRVELRFQDSTDRRKVLFHRLFKRSPSAPSAEIDNIIKSYLNIWKKFSLPMPSDYPDQLRESFPFTPELLDVALVRIRQSKGGFQGTRGALGFLAALVRSRCQSTHLITMADASMADPEMRSWLADLDPSQNLLTCAESNLNELRSYPYSDQIAAATLLATLAPSARQPGIAEDELARQIIIPESDYNQFSNSLTSFKKLGSYFHERAGSLYFDTKENAHSKVNLRSLTVSDEEAWERIVKWWQDDLLREPELVVFSEPAATQAALDSISQAEVRFVASPRRLKNEEIHQFYFGLKRRNTVVLMEPRDEKVDLRRNADLLKYAKNWLAADYLSRNAGDSAKSAEFSRIGGEDKRNAVEYLKKINFQHVQVSKFGPTPAECDFLRENLPPAATRDQLATHLIRTLYPAALLQEHLASRVTELVGKKVSQIEADYRNTLGFPMLMTHSLFQEAVCALVELGNVIGLKSSIGNYCGERPRLTADQLAESVVSLPFEVPNAPSSATQPVLSVFPQRPATDTAGNPPVPGTNIPASVAMPSVENIATPFLQSRQQVRQEIARLLSLEQHDKKRIVSIRIALTFDARDLEAATLPSFLRGSLSGPAKFSGESALEFNGEFTKAQVEAMVERLPDFNPGACRVTLGVQTKPE
jgi:hypothetical protein